jgi:hypothetical protein
MLRTCYVESGVFEVLDLPLRVVGDGVSLNRRSSDEKLRGVFVRIQGRRKMESWLRLALTCNRIEGCPSRFTRPNATSCLWRCSATIR